MANLMADPSALRRAIRAVGLGSLAAALETRAAQIDGHVTHEGWAKDDARRMFWQAAPLALADPAPLAASPLDPATAARDLAAAVRDGPLGRDFVQAAYAEDYFVSLLAGMLTVMTDEISSVDRVTPPLWRQTLSHHGIEMAPE